MQKKETTKNRIDSNPLYKKLASIAVPIAMQGVISSSLGLVDTLMVGFLGEADLAAVGIATQIYFVHWMILYGFTSGSATFTSQFYGAGDLKNIRKTIGFTVTIALLFGLLFFIIANFCTEPLIKLFSTNTEIIKLASGYIKTASPAFFFLGFTVPFSSALRSTQQTKIPLYISIVVFGSNTFLNYVFIFGKFGAPAMGVTGAAVGTLVARSIEVILILMVVFGRGNVIAGPYREFAGYNKELAIRITKNALPTTLNETLWGLGQTMYVVAFNQIGITAYAAFQAASSVNTLFTYAAFSIGDATLILVGQKLGEGKLEETYGLAKKLLKIGTIIGFFVGLLLIVSAKPLIGLFALSTLGKTYAIKILIIDGSLMALNLYNGILITGVLRGGGDTKFAMFSEVGCIWLIAVPIAFAGSIWWNLPVYWVVLLIKSEEVGKLFLLTKRFISKKWLNNIIHGL